MKRNTIIALSLLTAINAFAKVDIDNNTTNNLPLKLTSKNQLCFYERPNNYGFLNLTSGENIAKITVDETGMNFFRGNSDNRTGNATGIISFSDIPGILKLDISTGTTFECSDNDDHNKLYVYSSADNSEYKELLVVDATSEVFSYPLEKDTRYIKFVFTNTSGKCGQSYSPVKITLPKALSYEGKDLEFEDVYTETISDTISINYSNPVGNLVLSSDLENVTFSRLTEEESGKEGVARYIMTFVPETYGLFEGNITVIDEGYEGCDINIPVSINCTAELYPKTPVMSEYIQGYEKLAFVWDKVKDAVEYTLTLKDGENLITEIVTSETSCEITGLTRGAEYEVSLKSKADNGNYSLQALEMTISTFYDYGAQIGNLGFEEWDAMSSEKLGEEPKHWNSFATATGSVASFAAGIQIQKSEEVRPGSSGIYSANIFSKDVVLAVANGNMTTGQIIAGNASAISYDNHNKLIFGDEEFCQSIGSRVPDSVTVWLNYKPAVYREDMFARLSFIAHTEDEAVKDPRAKESAFTVAIADSNYNVADEWIRMSVPFRMINDGLNPEKLYILATFTTNSQPGKSTDSSNPDNVYIDDLLFVYNPSLEISSISKNTLEDNEEFVIGFDLSGTMSPSNLNEEPNMVTLEMSDIDGNFENPVIVSIEPLYTNDGGEIRGRIPENIHTGDYKIRVVTTNYPMESEPVNVKVEGAIQVGINENVASADYILYPNPAKDVVTVKGAEGLVYRIFSVNGAAMMSGTLPYNGSLEVSSLSNGIYFIEVEAADKSVSVIKFIKK